jgi:hypothetical protein
MKNTNLYDPQFGIYKTDTYTRFHPPDSDIAHVETSVKSMCVWKNKSTNGFTVYYNDYAGANYTKSSSLTNMANFNLACRSSATDNSTKTYFFNGQIKTLVIFNSNEESNLTAIKAAI